MPPKDSREVLTGKCSEFDVTYNPPPSVTDDEIRRDLKRFKHIARKQQKRHNAEAAAETAVTAVPPTAPLVEDKLTIVLKKICDGKLHEGNNHAVARKASESNATCAQIIGALATSVNVRGCDKYQRLTFTFGRDDGLDPSP